MKSKLLALSVLGSCMSVFAGKNMCVQLNDGQVVKYNVDSVEQVYYEDIDTASFVRFPIEWKDDQFKYNIMPGLKVDLIQNFYGYDSVRIYPQLTIDSKVYDVNIGASAFLRCDNLKSVIISEGVTIIGEFAFGYCSNLESITIPESVESIGHLAFYDCNKLAPKLLVYNNGSKCYGWTGPRDSCVNVVIPDGVTSIGEFAFKDCSSLKSITIPESVTAIGVGAFFECIGLSPKLLVYNNGTKCYGWVGAQDSCVNVEIPVGVISISDEAFYHCSNLKSITIPESVTTIGAGALGDCSSLKSITIPESVTAIGEGAFAGCENLEVVIENSKENVTVGENAFDGCKSVKYTK